MNLWEGNHQVRFMYQDSRGALTERDLVAKRLILRDGVLYLEGWSKLRDQHRRFRMSNVRSDVVSMETGEWWPPDQIFGLETIERDWLKSPDQSASPEFHPMDRMSPERALEDAGLVLGSKLTRTAWHVIPRGEVIGLHEPKKNGDPRKNPKWMLAYEAGRPKAWAMQGPGINKRFVRPSLAVEQFLATVPKIEP